MAMSKEDQTRIIAATLKGELGFPVEPTEGIAKRWKAQLFLMNLPQERNLVFKPLLMKRKSPFLWLKQSYHPRFQVRTVQKKTKVFFVEVMGSLCALPELGHIEDKKLSALVGVAPMNQNSDKTGKRYIKGGRGLVRKILYMAALSNIRFNSGMKGFYQPLRKNGKVAKVALMAVVIPCPLKSKVVSTE